MVSENVKGGHILIFGVSVVAGDHVVKHIGESEKNEGLGSDCGVVEEYFPWLGKCCLKEDSPAGDVFKENCSHCTLWSSLPDGGNLTTNHIIECSRYGYGKRIKG